MEGYRYDILCVVLLGGVGDVLLVDGVAEDVVPVLSEEQLPQVVAAVSYRVESSEQASDAGAAYEVYGDSKFFDIFQRTYLRRTFRPSAR